MSVQEGSKVSIHYTLTVDGNVVDSSKSGEPLRYVQGEGQIIPGLEKELSGMKKGDKKEVKISPAEGYGERNENAVQKVGKKMFKEASELKVGGVVRGESGGNPFQAVITALEGDEVTLDFNHPLAGKTLHFDVEVMQVEPATTN